MSYQQSIKLCLAMGTFQQRQAASNIARDDLDIAALHVLSRTEASFNCVPMQEGLFLVVSKHG